MGRSRKIKTKEERFWCKVDVRGPNDCWKWLGAKSKTGYGVFREDSRANTNSPAHVVSYIMHYGQYPVELKVLHWCYNHSCVNPAHLALGTAQHAVAERFRRVGYKKTDPVYLGREKQKRKTTEERFWSRVERRKKSECWEWKGGYGSSGYGGFSANGKSWGAHRFSYTLEYGEIPEGMLVLHQCDNPRCVNPNHLRLGTFQDNTDDMKIRGRSPKRGKRLSDREVNEIRQLYQTGKYWQKELVEMFGSNRNTINAIINRKTRWYSEELKK